MVSVTIDALEKEGSSELGSVTLHLPAETKLNSLPSVLPEYIAPDQLTRKRQDGTHGCKFQLHGLYTLKHPSEKIQVSADCRSSFNEQCINIDDSFLHFASLKYPRKALTARLDPDRPGKGEKIIVDDQLELTLHRTFRMPDDGNIHPLRISRGVFPLYNVEAFASQLPERITKRGGVFFPMWQGEALWIQFDSRNSNTRYAVRVNIGHVNAISGLDIFEVSDNQDYVIVPGQQWLDGIGVSPGVVRQFVAMPLGSGYSVGEEASGEQKFGGIQIEIIPSYEQNNHTFTYAARQGEHVSIAEHCTPREYQLKNGDMVTMAPNPSTFLGEARLCDFLDDEESFETTSKLYLKVCHSSTNKLPEFSSYEASESPSPETMEDSVLYMWLPFQSHSKPLQEMGIAAGGKLVQDVVLDRSPKGIWNTARAKSLDIHILHPPDFEAFTHIIPPKTPITTRDYIAAGIPFFVAEEGPGKQYDGSEPLSGVKGISIMDQQLGVQDKSNTEFDPLKPKRCETCVVQLSHCVIRPCNHQFCHICIKNVEPPSTCTPASRGQRRCPVCSTPVRHVAGFSAPMNLPGEETFKVDVPVVMLEVQDGRTAFQSVMEMRV
ncbi:hypothetical protein BDW62DRAFT_217829 [Aspergillus aurantiobrunneus]